jgi:hypothetical protein
VVKSYGKVFCCYSFAVAERKDELRRLGHSHRAREFGRRRQGENP